MHDAGLLHAGASSGLKKKKRSKFINMGDSYSTTVYKAYSNHSSDYMQYYITQIIGSSHQHQNSLRYTSDFTILLHHSPRFKSYSSDSLAFAQGTHNTGVLSSMFFSTAGALSPSTVCKSFD